MFSRQRSLPCPKLFRAQVARMVAAKKIEVIHNGVPQQTETGNEAESLRRELRIPVDAFIALSIGSIVPERVLTHY